METDKKSMPIIRLSHIYKAYGSKVVFMDFNMQVNKGDFLVVMGKSGAGKSTLLNMIGLLEEPDNGEIEICGEINPSIHSATGLRLLRSKIGYLFQNYGLIDNQTVRYNLELSSRFKKWNREQRNNSIAEALAKVNLDGAENKKVYQLSGGEQQRVAIAKLLIKSPDIILADEPTGSLDKANRDVVMSLLHQMNDDGKTILIVTHDEVVKLCAKESLTL